MAKIINNRIYLECELDNTKSYMNEMEYVISLCLDKHVIIWEQSKQEEKHNKDELFDVYISMNKLDANGAKIFDKSIWPKLVGNIINRSKFLQIGCWKSELNLIDEIKSVSKILYIEENGEQLEFFIELDEPVKELVIRKYLGSNGSIKWFNFGLYCTKEKDSLIFSSSHFGEQYFILTLSTEDVEKMIIAVENNDAFIRINRH